MGAGLGGVLRTKNRCLVWYMGNLDMLGDIWDKMMSQWMYWLWCAFFRKRMGLKCSEKRIQISGKYFCGEGGFKIKDEV